MADTQIQAMIARFDSSTAGAMVTASGKLWFGEIPADKTLPFVGLAHGGSSPEYNTEDTYDETDRFSFEVHDTDIENVERIATEIKKAFDLPGTNEAKAALPITNASTRSCERTNYVVTVDPNEDYRGQTVYIAVLEYTVIVRKTIGVS
jgi:hypothetical protein